MIHEGLPRNVWLPIDQFDVEDFLAMGEDQDTGQEQILLYGYDQVIADVDYQSIWMFRSVDRHWRDNSVCYRSELSSFGEYIKVVPFQFMIVPPPSTTKVVIIDGKKQGPKASGSLGASDC